MFFTKKIICLLLFCNFTNAAKYLNIEGEGEGNDKIDFLDPYLTNEERTINFEVAHLNAHGTFVHPGREAARKNILDQLLSDPGFLWESTRNIQKEGVGHLVKKVGETASKKIMAKATNWAVANAVVAGTFSKGATYGGRRMAVVAAEQTAQLALSQGMHQGAQGSVSLAGKGIFKMAARGVCKTGSFTSAVGAELGRQAARYTFGKEAFYAQNIGEMAGAIATGAAFGSVGGPIGAAGGAAMAAAGVTISKGLGGLINSGLGVKGPNDNWAYIQVLKAPYCENYHIRSYARSDTWRWKSYWHMRLNCGKIAVISAGQKQNQDFQLYMSSAWDYKIMDLRSGVKYGDYIFMGRDRRVWKHCAVWCRSGNVSPEENCRKECR